MRKIATPLYAGRIHLYGMFWWNLVLGNFVKNINLAAGNKVTAVNYLGDCGTQFGLLSLGYQNFGDSRLLEENPLKHLHSVYLQACRALGSTNEGKAMASALATKLEGGQRPDLVDLWQRFRALSLKELQSLYARMNICFDHYEYESDFVIFAKQLVEHLIKRRIARREADGSVTASSYEPGKRVTLLKSDGGTLYLTRDLAAAISRANCYNFDRMHYIVEDGQREHFMNLSHLLTHLCYDWAKASVSPWPLHVRFARVGGASSRRGNGLFLEDVLNAAKQEARRRMLQSPNTRIMPSDGVMFESVADHLGVTWLMAEMLRRPRLQPVYLNLRCHDNQPCGHNVYSVAETPDLTGLGLQYCHARLFSLEQKAISRGLLGNGDADAINSQLLHAFHKVSSDRTSREVEEEVCGHLALLPDVLTYAYVKYEADGLLRYCTRLTSLISRAWQFLPVLTAESQELGLSRMAVFRMARNTLEQGHVVCSVSRFCAGLLGQGVPGRDAASRGWGHVVSLGGLRRAEDLGFRTGRFTYALEIPPRIDWSPGSMLFVCVLQESPEPRTRRGASFYEIHEIHIPQEQINALRNKVYLVEVTFETAALDPFPPGCGHVFGQRDGEIEACYEKLDRRVHLPELYNNNSGMFIYELTTDEKPQQLPYLQETLLSEAGLFCAKHQCDVKIIRSALHRNSNPIVLDEHGNVLDTETNNKSMAKEIEPWRDSMKNAVEHPLLDMFRWMPTLRFEFTHPSMSCGRLKNLFDVVITKNNEKNLPYPRAWRKSTGLHYLSSLLSTSFWRKQDKPHQVYFAPVFCTKSTAETSRVQGRLPAGTSIYPFRGMTFVWSVHWRQFFKPIESASQPRIRSIQVTINSAGMSFVSTFINCGDVNCTLSMDVRLYTALSHSVYILPNQMFLNQSSSSFALVLDGPEFSYNTGTFDRRLQLLRDGHLMVLGTYTLPQMRQQSETSVQATEFLTCASAFAQTRSRKFDIIIRFYNWPIYDLSSGSFSRRQLAWSMIPQPCRRTAILPPFHPLSSLDPSKTPFISVNFLNDTK
ncbi:hypothetical protein TcWFU_008676 [Taenia crassiceps]|uniref:Probable arginine--tRNA ligase, mitochondrial n=1 Tax=Taenia crassiceps TaxID=6207 RepID=A0ABR4Q3U7_9CEST